jgi:hypothetical protein
MSAIRVEGCQLHWAELGQGALSCSCTDFAIRIARGRRLRPRSHAGDAY